jgi:hypothetical protein
MPPQTNPLRLNSLQLRTLTILQQLTRTEGVALPAAEDGSITVTRFPAAHGNHFHLGDRVVYAKDCTGLTNPAVYNALARKGLIREGDDGAVVVTREGLDYDTGPARAILHDPAAAHG